MFEVFKTDLAARIGAIRTNHGRVETPAYVPVVHPARQTVPPGLIREMGFEMVITNAYITRNHYGEEAVRRGIHDIIGFDGAVMTDSGGYQVLEYGGVGVGPDEIAGFERGIMTDLAIPLDRPTGFGMPLRRAEAHVRHTQRVSRRALEESHDNGQIWIGPIQGGEHSGLVARSAKGLVDAGFRMLALGSPVEFMESYEYALLAQMIVAAKGRIPHSVPLHLFGAGHPLTIPFAVALGCDTFDSASYVLYARQRRYITPDGTRHLKDIESFPCDCAVCSRYTPGELRGLDGAELTGELAVHNLHAIKLEVDKTRQSIHEGRLWEHVMEKARAHPRLYEIVGVMTANPKMLGAGTPRFKARAIFLYGSEDQYRPEVQSYHEAVRRFRAPAAARGRRRRKDGLIITAESATKPGYLSPQYRELRKRFGDGLGGMQVCQYSPHLGLIPIELSDVYPAAHHETARVRFDPKDFPVFAETWRIFFRNNCRFSTVYYDRGDEFLGHFIRTLPRGIKRKPL